MSKIGIEIPLDATKPMVMLDEDIKHFKAMFTACMDKFSTKRDACNVVAEAAYMTDLHIDLFEPKTYATHVKPYAEFSNYIEYPVYNACSGGRYDVVLRLGKHPDGKFSVDFVRPDEKVRE